jgi:hypothetical protein
VRPVGKPRPTPVQDDQTREGGETFHASSDGWVFLQHVEVGGPGRNEHDIGRAIAQNLVSDVHPVVHGVTNLSVHDPESTKDAAFYL